MEVKKIISKLNTDKFTDLDGISPEILKCSGNTIIPYIIYIIHVYKSIHMGSFSDKLHVFESGSRDISEIKAQFSILPTISKIFERYIASHLQVFFQKKYT
jgi:hypothetical protein